MKWYCEMCGGDEYEWETLEESAKHLEQMHGAEIERWPDGSVVVDESDVADDLLAEDR